MARAGCPQVRDDAMAAQVAWVAHRRRKVAAHVALSNQMQGHLDLVFPGLGACFDGILATKAGRVIVRDRRRPRPDAPSRLRGPATLRCSSRCGAATAPRPTSCSTAAKVALRLPTAERAPVAALLAADVALLDAIDDEIRRAEDAARRACSTRHRLVCSISLPGVGVVRASAYGAAIGDPCRFPNAGAAYRASGLVPAEYSSAGRRRGGQHISREGSVELRSAIIELGRGLAGHDDDFAAYRRRLRSNGKRPAVAAVAVGHRAHRLAFAMLRDPSSPTTRTDGPPQWRTGPSWRRPEAGPPERRNPPAGHHHGPAAPHRTTSSPDGELDGGGRDRRRYSYAARTPGLRR